MPRMGTSYESMAVTGRGVLDFANWKSVPSGKGQRYEVFVMKLLH